MTIYIKKIASRDFFLFRFIRFRLLASYFFLIISPSLIFSTALPSYPENFKNETKHLFTSSNFYLVGMGGLAFSQGLNHFTSINENLNPLWENSYRKSFLRAGDIFQFQGLFLATATYANNNSLQALAYMDSLILSSLFSFGLKFAVNEKRPRGGGHGWPSGHTTAAASALGVSIAYGSPLLISISAFGTLLTAYSRLLHHRKKKSYHSFTQVMAGLFLGTVSAYFMAKWNKENFGNTELPKQKAQSRKQISVPIIVIRVSAL